MVDIFASKVAMSRNPICIRNREDCIVVTIYGPKDGLAFARLGDQMWTDINVSSKFFEDIVYSNGSFYTVNYLGWLFICEMDGPKANLIALTPCHDPYVQLHKK